MLASKLKLWFIVEPRQSQELVTICLSNSVSLQGAHFETEYNTEGKHSLPLKD